MRVAALHCGHVASKPQPVSLRGGMSAAGLAGADKGGGALGGQWQGLHSHRTASFPLWWGRPLPFLRLSVPEKGFVSSPLHASHRPGVLMPQPRRRGQGPPPPASRFTGRWQEGLLPVQLPPWEASGLPPSEQTPWAFCGSWPAAGQVWRPPLPADPPQSRLCPPRSRLCGRPLSAAAGSLPRQGDFQPAPAPGQEAVFSS